MYKYCAVLGSPTFHNINQHELNVDGRSTPCSAEFVEDHEIIKYLHFLLFLHTEIFLCVRKVPIHAVITIVADDLAMQGAI